MTETMAMSEIIWGIVGCGDVTERKSGPGFSRVSGSRLGAVMRRDATKAEDYAKRHGVPRWYDSVDELLADSEVNTIYVATPTSSHCDLTVRALESGRPVLVEKPMALNAGETRRMRDASERTGQKLFVAYYRRALPRFEALRELVQSGRLGPIFCIDVRHMKPLDPNRQPNWKADPAVNGGGLFVDVQVHVLDWLDHVFGPPNDAHGMVRRLGNGPGDDLVAYQLGWPSGILASGIACFGGAPADEHVMITGRDGTARMPFLHDGPIEITWRDGRVEHVEQPDPPHVHEPLIARIVEDLRGGRPAPATAEAGARTTALVDRLYADWRAAS